MKWKPWKKLVAMLTWRRSWQPENSAAWPTFTKLVWFAWWPVSRQYFTSFNFINVILLISCLFIHCIFICYPIYLLPHSFATHVPHLFATQFICYPNHFLPHLFSTPFICYPIYLLLHLFAIPFICYPIHSFATYSCSTPFMCYTINLLPTHLLPIYLLPIHLIPHLFATTFICYPINSLPHLFSTHSFILLIYC